MFSDYLKIAFRDIARHKGFAFINAAEALDEPFSVVLTQETARKYFGSEDAMGRCVSNSLITGWT